VSFVRTLPFALAFVATFAFADVKTDLLAAHEAMVEAGKFRTKGTSTTKDGTQELWSEVQWPDRFHARNAGGEFIMIPGKSYMKQGGRWMAVPMDMSAMVKNLTPDAIRQSYANITNEKDHGESTLDGATVHVYEYDTSATIMGIKADSHVKVWIDTDTGRVVKQEVEGSAAGMKSKTVQTYDYDPSIEVKAPL